MDTGASTPPPRHPLRTAVGFAAASAWLAAVIIGIGAMFRYSAEPGAAATPPARWPANTLVVRDEHRPSLLVFAHPHCVCTRATLAELGRALTRCPGRLSTTVCFFTDQALGPDWARSASWDQAAAIPGVRVVADPDGALARAFGANTSGTAVLYAPDGTLHFHGGLTASRGHEGDNAGCDAIAGFAHHLTTTTSTAVYGCALHAPARATP